MACYRLYFNFISCLVCEIFWSEVASCPSSWMIFLPHYVTSQAGIATKTTSKWHNRKQEAFEKLLLTLKIWKLTNVPVFDLYWRVIFKDKGIAWTSLWRLCISANIQDGGQYATCDPKITRTKQEDKNIPFLKMLSIKQTENITILLLIPFKVFVSEL